MPITRQNILAHEWIGLEVIIRESTDPHVEGLSGVVTDETKNTFKLQAIQRTLRISKLQTTLNITLPTGENLTVNGRDLKHRPEDRVKKGLNKW